MEFNLEKEIKCICGTIFEENDFAQHIKKCEQFKEVFTDFDNKISKFIKSYSNPKEQLLIIKFILERYYGRFENRFCRQSQCGKINTV